MKIERLLVVAEGMFWMGLIGLALALTALIGCGESSPLAPEGGDISTVGELKSDIDANDDEGVSGILHVIRMDGVAGSPALLEGENGDDLEIKIKTYLKGSYLVIEVVAEEGAVVSRDEVKVYWEGEDDGYFGRYRVPTGGYLEKLVLGIEEEDIPEDEEEIIIIVIVERDDEEIAKDSADADLSELSAANGPVLEKISGDEDEVILTFSDRVDARSSIKYNVDIIIDGVRLKIRSYREDGDEVALIMREDLVAGEYELSYNGEGGLRGLDGEDVQEFSETFTVEAEAEDIEPWLSVKVGILNSDGDVVAGTLTAQGIKMTPWAEGIVRDGVRVERREEWMDLYALTEADLGLTGNYTIEDVYDAGEDLGYTVVPEEAAVTAVFLGGHENGEHYLVMSDFLRYDRKDHLLVITRKPVGQPTGDWLAAHRFSSGLQSGVVAGHTFVFAR